MCTSKLGGGLGIKSSRQMNQALLGKWLWRLGDMAEGLWRHVVMEKYGNQGGGWEVNDINYKHSAIWKRIVSTKRKVDAEHQIPGRLMKESSVLARYMGKRGTISF